MPGIHSSRRPRQPLATTALFPSPPDMGRVFMIGCMA